MLIWLLRLLHGSLVLPAVLWVEAGLEHAEESSKAFIRESFGVFNRCFDGAGAWVLSVLDASYAGACRCGGATDGVG
jgi:hypothetical protein